VRKRRWLPPEFPIEAVGIWNALVRSPFTVVMSPSMSVAKFCQDAASTVSPWSG
jgi:hypothetical protein